MAIFITVIMSNISKIAKLIDDKAITFIMVIKAIVVIRLANTAIINITVITTIIAIIIKRSI